LTGLNHLHSRNIIYRDFKPDNLLISPHPRMKLADFGNVHFSLDDKSVVRGKEGTESYMSPEMRMGRNYNTKTDIWSFGITMLNILFDDDSFPNFDNMGPWAARKYADQQQYTSLELKDFIQSLFLKSSDRPTAAHLLEVRVSYLNLAYRSILSYFKRINPHSRNCFVDFPNKILDCQS
jgi:serine/threonine protein kinase